MVQWSAGEHPQVQVQQVKVLENPLVQVYVLVHLLVQVQVQVHLVVQLQVLR